MAWHGHGTHKQVSASPTKRTQLCHEVFVLDGAVCTPVRVVQRVLSSIVRTAEYITCLDAFCSAEYVMYPDLVVSWQKNMSIELGLTYDYIKERVTNQQTKLASQVGLSLCAYGAVSLKAGNALRPHTHPRQTTPAADSNWP